MSNPTLTRAELDALEESRYAAMVSGDLDALGALFSDDMLYAHSNASVDTKSSYLELLRTGALTYHRLEHATEAAVLRPGVAIVSGTMSGEITMHGNDKTLNSRVSAVWIYEGGQWRLVAFQPTPIPV